MKTFDLKTYLEDAKVFFDEQVKKNWLTKRQKEPENLFKAITYSFFAPGKRIRPVLTFASAEVLGLSRDDVLPIAASLEMIHSFSLIHDDLPAMDDDEMRRGQPTNHKVFGEATAILAGDALLARAIEPLTQMDSRKFLSQNLFKVIRQILRATGAEGMVGGQVSDMESEGQTISLEALQNLHLMKTGALIQAAVVTPAILSGQGEDILKFFFRYGESIGLAFQIADDILDIEGGIELGKDIGSDEEKKKSTYPALLGLDGAKKELRHRYEQALEALADFDEKALPLREIARFIIERKY